MITTTEILIPKLSDRSIIECFKKIEEQYDDFYLSSITINSLNSEENQELLKDSGNLEEILSYDSILIETCALENKSYGFSIQYNRDPEPFFSKIKIYTLDNRELKERNKEPLHHQYKIKIIALISKELKAFDPTRTIQGNLSEEQHQLLAQHDSTLKRLEHLNEDLIRETAQFRTKLEQELSQKKEEFESKLENEYQKKADTLEAEKRELEKRKKEIDDRNNTHVRREIRDRMLDDVKKRIKNFGVSESTEKKRQPVFIGMTVLAACLLVLTIFTAYEISIATIDKTELSKIQFYWLWARFTLFSFGLLGTILYYIKWQNRWAEQHSGSEFQLQQFYIDVNRANWVIESCLEWKKETGSEIPPELLQSITRNLFVLKEGELESVIHPADELASALLGSASNLKLNVAGNEIEFNKPSKIKKDIQSKSSNLS